MSAGERSTPADELARKKRLLVERLLQREQADASRRPIVPRPPELRDPPLSFNQEGLWLINRMDPSPAYNTLLPIRFRGTLDVAVLQRVLDEVVRRHEVLRTTLPDVDSEPVQRIADPAPVSIVLEELRAGLSDEEYKDETTRRLDEELGVPFDLAAGPLFRAKLIRCSESLHVLFLSMHHAVFDGSSGGILYSEVCRLYEAFANGQPSPLEELPVQYADYALWQRDWLSGAVLDKQLTYWRERLEGAETLDLMPERQRPSVPSPEGVGRGLTVSKALSESLRELSRKESVTPFQTLLAAFQLLLSRYSGQDDILVGSPVTLRRKSELEGMIGYFVNMVVLRGDLSGDPSFRELLSRVRETTTGAFANSEMPFDKLVRDLQLPRDARINPLFQVAFILEAASGASGDGIAEQKLPGVTVEVPLENPWAMRFDLEANLRDAPEGLRMRLAGSADQFDEERLERMLDHFRVLLESIVRTPDRPVTELALLPQREREQVTWEWSGERTEYPRDATIPELFAQQVERTPDNVALAYEGDTLSYRALDARANQLARWLRAQGVAAGTRVGLCTERSLERVVGILGILKAGGAYVPLDPDYPAARLQFMVQDTGAQLLLTQAHLLEELGDPGATMFCLDRDWVEVEGESGNSLPADFAGTGPLDPAYVIYTSGSTGMPKGTCVAHRSVVRLVHGTNFVELGPDEVFLQLAAISFDASTFELWGSLLHGAKLVMFPSGVPALAELGKVIREEGVTTLWLTAALFHQMVDEQLDSLSGVKQLLAGGDALSVPHVKRLIGTLSGDRRLINGYGPTENTTFTCCHVMTRDSEIGDTVPIGRPISNTTVYLLDGRGEPVPVGVAGTLFTGGDGVALEYLNQPELTAERFVPDPFSEVHGGRLYDTGDRARWRADGTIEFLGRIDQQVKIRGFRVELGEIESALIAHPQIRDAAVITREDAPGDRRLVAYVVADGDVAPTAPELRVFVRERIPEYMVPAAFVPLERFPLTANGKLDREALPEPEGERQVDQAYVAPESELEQQIAEIWRDALEVETVGVSDNFFDLGGHSLLLVRVHSLMEAALGRSIPIVELFQFPTIESISRHLGGALDERSLVDEARGRARRRGDGGEEPIAIVGMAGRFPGAGSIDAFWENLRAGVESITYSSDEDLIAAGVDPALLRDPRFVPARGILDDADRFDAPFFGYAPREAELIDPQQRVFLECAWEALENAGYAPQAVGVPVGVYAGASPNTYINNLPTRPDLMASVDGLAVTLGSERDFLATRVSYKLDLLGPSMNVQTACSTSLVAVHSACRALRDHDCDMALAGGVSVKVPRGNGHLYLEQGIGSPDGHCRAFDAAAEGTVGGDGVGIVVLKRLSEAVEAGDAIRAVIRGTALNNDGSLKVGYTAPSVEGQAEAIALAQASAGVDADSISYVEAHGTGTALGDPIEIAALTKVFGGTSREKGSCALGALKSNVGHLDAAAGVAGLIKTVLCLEHGELVPSLHYEQPNPSIDFDAGPFRVNTVLRTWPTEAGALRRAGVSSFGLGGTNAHAVLEEAPHVERAQALQPRRWELLCLSARTASALEAASERLAAHLRANPELDLADVAFTLHVGRCPLAHRRVLLAQSIEDAVVQLEAGSAGRRVDGRAPSEPRPVTFLFSGQGAQHPNMGRALYEHEPVYRAAVDTCAETLEPHLRLDLRTLLFPDDTAVDDAAERLRRTSLTQPALFVTEYALAKLWMSWGVEPTAMLGHSIGEYVAACLAGVFSLEDALALVATRGRLMDALPTGSMLSVSLSPSELTPLLGDDLSIAAVNGPALCAVSGPEPAIAALEKELDARELAPRRLHTSHAFHSKMMDPILDEFTACVQKLELHAPELPFVSNLTGTWITDAQAIDPTYWAQHLRQAVRFADGLETLFAEPQRVFLEVGPGRTLQSLAAGHPDRPPASTAVQSLPLPRDTEDAHTFALRALAQLWVAGAEADLVHAEAGEARRRVPLPSYAFSRERYWIEPGTGAHTPARTGRSPDLADWFFVPSWKRVPRAVVRTPTRDRWLVFGDPGPLRDALVARLEALGRDVVYVCADERFDPTSREDHERLFNSSAESGGLPDAIVHLWNTSDDSGLEQSFYAPAALVQALSILGRNDGCSLTLVTSQAHEVMPGEPLRPETGAVIGLCREMKLEHPDIRCSNVDVLPGDVASATEALVDALIAEADDPTADAIIALRSGSRWVQTMEPLPLTPQERTPALLRDHGVYLVLGGFGGLGRVLSDHLARSLGAHIILASRTADETSERNEFVQSLRDAGAEVRVRAVDVADASALESLVREIEQEFGRLDGVLHAAGAEKTPELIEQLTLDVCERQFRPKLAGLAALAEVLRERELDFCLLCSSLSSILGVGGYAAYSASHALMDAFALRENRQGRTRWISVNWDNWNTHEVDPRELSPGFAEFVMSPAEGTDALGRVLGTHGLAQIAVSTGDLPTRMQRVGRQGAEHGNGLGDETAASLRHPRPELDAPYVAPRHDVERKLVDIWEGSLGIDGIGIHDNFFELGGDSVVNLQIVSRAGQAGLRLTPKQVFDDQTIAELALNVGDAAGAETDAEQGVVTGELPLTPVQHWFVEQDFAQPNHFNQARMLSVPGGADRSVLSDMLDTLMRHHDALRLRLTLGNDGPTLRVAEPGPKVEILHVDLNGRPASDCEARVAEEARALHTTLDLASGPLLGAVYFDSGPAAEGRLLLVIHHLVVDEISWPILLEDLAALYEQISGGRAPVLPPKTTSFRAWSIQLAEYAQSLPDSEADAWLAQPASAASLPVDGEGPNTSDSTETVWVEVPESATQELLQTANRTYNTQTNDLLIAALARSVGDWTGQPGFRVLLEGHGREAPFDGVDVSRTVGWFTSLYPVALELPADAHDPRSLIPAVKEQLRRVPRQGLSYGLLRYLAQPSPAQSALAAQPEPECVFLYLGRGGAPAPADSLVGSLHAVAEPVGELWSPASRRTQLLEVTARVVDGRLVTAFTYSRNVHRRETIEGFAGKYADALSSLIAHCRDAETSESTPSDFTAAALGQSDLDKIRQQLKQRAQ